MLRFRKGVQEDAGYMLFGTRAKITVAVGLSFALIFLMLGISELRRPAKASTTIAIREPAPAAILPLATAARAIQTGETITADMIRTSPGDPVRNASIASPVEVQGKVAITPIPAGALIARSAVGFEDKLAIRVPVGMRAIAIDTTDEIAVAGLIRPGDRVDIQTVYPGADATSGVRGSGHSRAVTLLQFVQVLAVGDTVVGMDANAADTGTVGKAIAVAPQPARTVTLALSPDQVSTLALAKSMGALYLTLRNPADQAVASFAAAAEPPMPAAVRPAPARAAHARPARSPRPAAAGHRIELVVGDRHAMIYAGGGGQ